jgi:hypothetical protein
VGDQDTIVRPKADGEDIGTITLTSGLNFKTKIASNSDMQALYAGGLEYDFEIEIENTGALDCTAARFDLALDDGLTLISGETTGILRTIEPGKTRLIPVRLKCGAINDEYEFKRIAIRIEDSLNGNVWNDSVSVKFNIGVVNFAIQSETPVNGVVITPHGKAYSFKCDYAYRGYSWYAADTDEKCKTTVSVPWSASDFLVVFSGATADTETVYNMGVNIPNLDDNFTGFLDVMNYEPNNAEAQATQISDSTPIMSYLHKNDIDYYSVNVRATQPALRTLAVRDCLVVVDRSYGTYPAPDDKRIVSGGQYRMELEVAGLLPELETTYTFVLSTGSEYAEITKAAGSIANLTGAGSWSRGNLSTGGRYGYWTKVLDGNNDFRFSLPEHCPPGVKLPFVITIADQLGNEWKELVQVPVEP